MSQIKCGRCGNIIDGNSKFCPNCGAPSPGNHQNPTQPLPGGGYYPPVQQYPSNKNKSNSNSTILLYALIALVAIGIGVLCFFCFIKDNGSSSQATDGENNEATTVVEHVDTITKVVEVEKPVPTPAPAPEVKKPTNYLPDGYYYLRGRISGKSSSNDVSFEFTISNGQVSSGTYVNITADDGSTYVNLRKNGNTISGSGIDNIGSPFNFSFTAKSYNSFSGALYFGGKIRMNMTLTKYN